MQEFEACMMTWRDEVFALGTGRKAHIEEGCKDCKSLWILTVPPLLSDLVCTQAVALRKMKKGGFLLLCGFAGWDCPFSCPMCVFVASSLTGKIKRDVYRSVWFVRWDGPPSYPMMYLLQAVIIEKKGNLAPFDFTDCDGPLLLSFEPSILSTVCVLVLECKQDHGLVQAFRLNGIFHEVSLGDNGCDG